MMETILETSHSTTTVPRASPEAASFSVLGPTQLGTETTVSSSTGVGGLHGRSASLNLPLARKASFRVRAWVKRSGSSRTVPSSESLKGHIKHLGGGRVEDVDVNLLVPVARRKSRSRPSSPDSRVTHWLDFYPDADPPETGSKPQPNTPLGPFLAEKRSSRRQRSGSTNSDLRPAPLRVPSIEKATPGKEGDSSDSVATPPKTLSRKSSKWKPLPLLPAQRVGLQPPEAEKTALLGDGETKTAIKKQDAEKPSLGEDLSPRRDDLGILPVIRLGTPPPTPDSSTGGAASMRHHLVGDNLKRDRKSKSKDTEKPPSALSSSPDGTGSMSRRRERPGAADSKGDTANRVRHTRKERIFLHVNYRGEAPFLKAWGLDIKKPADRVEGLAILRDLMQAERERNSMVGSKVVVQG
ncbi:hypothetical protein N658DRAFT_569231 [Parathielavia hyrcaniae]|uniref:Uncharacterized protein n=1 Tax=Parathielavia hyrcaniae TaxID=113614 RepID=A0AAN6SYD7_9PEZI|nr:hypothetical protein N658DRAFT_569231 [Parathielavia hyrcaniae]